MAKERGKRLKRLLHLLHLLFEFLRQIMMTSATSIGKIAKTTTKKVGGKSIIGRKKVSKSASSKSKLLAKGSVSVGSATASTSILSGLTAGTVLSAKTLGIVLITGSLFFGGLGTYGYIAHENPFDLFGKSPTNTGNQNANQQPQTTQPPTQNSQSNQTVQTTSQASGTSGGTGYTSSGVSTGYVYHQQTTQASHKQPNENSNKNSDDSGTTTPSFNYTVPENP